MKKAATKIGALAELRARMESSAESSQVPPQEVERKRYCRKKQSPEESSNAARTASWPTLEEAAPGEGYPFTLTLNGVKRAASKTIDVVRSAPAKTGAFTGAVFKGVPGTAQRSIASVPGEAAKTLSPLFPWVSHPPPNSQPPPLEPAQHTEVIPEHETHACEEGRSHLLDDTMLADDSGPAYDSVTADWTPPSNDSMACQSPLLHDSMSASKRAHLIHIA